MTEDTRPLPLRFGIEQSSEWNAARIALLRHSDLRMSQIEAFEAVFAAMIRAARLPEQSHHGRRKK